LVKECLFFYSILKKEMIVTRGLICIGIAIQLVLSAYAQDYLNVLSFNIRFDNPRDTPNHWLNRVDKVSSQILFHQADIVGIQEALFHQIDDLKMRMLGYESIGVGRDDGKQKGEFSNIFYNTRRVNLQQSETFWLSLTPKVPGSKSWDAAITRIVTWARFKDKVTGKVFYHFNTHFDHIGKMARKESAHLLMAAVDSIAGKLPVIITGDFNAHPQDESILALTETNNPLKFMNTKELSATVHFGPTGTFNAFGNREQSDFPIDYIFLRGTWKVLQHATLSQTWQGRFSSDHFPVFARLGFEK
jgi:endonuclease/exonuclease/phosphatase family metal-dependent hydrolase